MVLASYFQWYFVFVLVCKITTSKLRQFSCSEQGKFLAAANDHVLMTSAVCLTLWHRLLSEQFSPIIRVAIIQTIDAFVLKQPKLSSVQNATAVLSPILPLPSAPNGGEGGGEGSELPTVSAADTDEGMAVTVLGNRASPAKSATTEEAMPSASSTSPSTLPQLPPIPVKYRRPMLLDTSEIARQTKDMLLKCAISQRSFGQNVLGKLPLHNLYLCSHILLAVKLC